MREGGREGGREGKTSRRRDGGGGRGFYDGVLRGTKREFVICKKYVIIYADEGTDGYGMPRLVASSHTR